jgi:ATP-dependent RNA helicase DDX42
MSKLTFNIKKGGAGGGLAGLAGLLRPAAVATTATAPPAAAPAPAAAEAAPAPAADEVDPLESFMNEIASTVEEQERKRARTGGASSSAAWDVGRDAAAATTAGALDDTEEAGEGYLHDDDGGGAGDNDDEDYNGSGGGDGELLYDSDGEVVGVRRGATSGSGGGSKRGGGPAAGDAAPSPLPPVDHSKVAYAPFRREFYAPLPAVAELTPPEVAALRAELGVAVDGPGAIPAPVQSFMHLGLDVTHPALVTTLARVGYEAPTPVQAQALPALLAGRDVLGLAQTGSGKTLAFVLPLVRHAAEQRELDAGDGPIGLVLAPTRELATQIHAEARRFAKPLGLAVALLTGGSSKWEQSKALRAGAEVVVATPGRLLDHLTGSDASTNLRRVTFLVLDEADRMLDMGFTAQVQSILGGIRPDRQAALFSATLPRRVQALADGCLRSPVRLTVGTAGAAAAEVEQTVAVLPQGAKWDALLAALPAALARGKVLVFVSQRTAAEELSASLNRAPAVRAAVEAALAAAASQQGGGPAARAGAVVALCLHGDKHQSERDDVIRQFKAAGWGAAAAAMQSPSSSAAAGAAVIPPPLLVATDVASRGLDIRGVGTVVSFDAARDISSHVHRVGRTGRVGSDGLPLPGVALTFVQPTEASFACELVRSLRESGKPVPRALEDVARANPNKYRWATGPLTAGGGGGVSSGGGGSGRSGGGKWSSSSSSSSSSAAAGGGGGGYTRRDGTFVPPPIVGGGNGGVKRGAVPMAPGLGFGSAADGDSGNSSSIETAVLQQPYRPTGAAAVYRPPLPAALAQQPSEGAAAAVAPPSPQQTALDRTVAAVRAAAAAAAAARSAGADSAHASDFWTSEEQLAAADGNADDDVVVAGDDEDEQTSLRRARQDRFQGRFATAAAAPPPVAAEGRGGGGSGGGDDLDAFGSGAAVAGTRASALAELRATATTRLAQAFGASFVSSGSGSSSAAPQPPPPSAPAPAAAPPAVAETEGTGGAAATGSRKRSRWGPAIEPAAADAQPAAAPAPQPPAQQQPARRVFY